MRRNEEIYKNLSPWQRVQVARGIAQRAEAFEGPEPSAFSAQLPSASATTAALVRNACDARNPYRCSWVVGRYLRR